MKYKLIQYKNNMLAEFNSEINSLLEDGWKLEGDYRITTFDNSEAIVYTQVLTREDDKPVMGFQITPSNSKIKKKK